jgi:hypothetical protein
MLVVRSVKAWIYLMAQHWRITLPCFVAGALLYLGIGAAWHKDYTGLAVVELNPATDWRTGGPGQHEMVDVAVRQAAARADWAALVTRFHLYPQTVDDGKLGDAANYLASQVSVEQVDDAKRGAPVVRISYTDTDRSVVLGVTQAVADNLTKPVAAEAPLAQIPPSADTLATTVPPAASTISAKVRKRVHSEVRDSAHAQKHSGLVADPESGRQVQAVAAEGSRLQEASRQNAVTLNRLRQELQEEDRRLSTAATVAAPPPVTVLPAPKMVAPKPDPQSNPQLARLRAELASSEAALADLRKRYTDDYPDVVEAREKLHEVQLDVSRLTAVEAASNRPEARAEANAPPVAPPVATTRVKNEAARNAIARQLQEAQAAQDKLQLAIGRNRALLAGLQSEMAAKAVGDPDRIEANPGPPSVGDARPAPMRLASSAAPVAASGLGASGLAVPGPAVPGLAVPDLVVPDRGRSTTEAGLPPTAAAAAPAASGMLSVAEAPTITVSPIFFAAPWLWMLSVAFGASIALLATWLTELRDPSIRSEGMLRHVLPTTVAYLGGVPRIHHEVIPE